MFLFFWSRWFHLFSHVDFVFLVSSILWIVVTYIFVCVELAIARFSLVALSYQLPLIEIRINNSVYGLTISTTCHYSVHNLSYLTLNHLDRILLTKQTRNKWPWFPSGPYHTRPFDLLRFIMTYGQKVHIIFHIEYFYVHISSFYLHLSAPSKNGGGDFHVQ